MIIHTACKFCLQWNVQRFYISVWNLQNNDACTIQISRLVPPLGKYAKRI